jgi:hypothetical protein
MASSMRKLMAGAAAFATLAIAWVGMASAQAARLTATAERPATLAIALPRNAAAIYLDIWVKAYTPPQRGAAEAIVSLMPAHGGQVIEVGSFTVFPAAAFSAKEASDMRAYRFNAGAALRALADAKELSVRVALDPIGAGTAMTGAKLLLDRAEFSPPP